MFNARTEIAHVSTEHRWTVPENLLSLFLLRLATILDLVSKTVKHSSLAVKKLTIQYLLKIELSDATFGSIRCINIFFSCRTILRFLDSESFRKHFQHIKLQKLMYEMDNEYGRHFAKSKGNEILIYLPGLCKSVYSPGTVTPTCEDPVMPCLVVIFTILNIIGWTKNKYNITFNEINFIPL